jgi:hypothetical protein
MKAYEDHARLTGGKVSHPLMKEMLAGFATAEVDKLFETKGLDFLIEKRQSIALLSKHINLLMKNTQQVAHFYIIDNHS